MPSLPKNRGRSSKNNLARAMAESKRGLVELLRLNRTLRARNRSNQVMIRAKNELEYAREACKIVVEDCGHAMVWIGFAEQDRNKTVRPIAFGGFEEGYLETLNLTWADTERGRGPTGTSIRTGKPSICHNMLTDPKFRPWRQQALERGYASCIALPLLIDGKPFGNLNIYSKEPETFTEEEVGLLSGLAGDLSYGIGALRTSEARKLAETHFHLSQKMEAVGLLAGGIAHDFNNILAIISGNNDLLLEELLPGHPLREHSLEIKQSSEVGAALTQQLLGISGNRGLQNRFVDPNSVILQMQKLLRRLLRDNIRIATNLHRSVWPVKMGSGELEQIILNLAVNARDAMPRGGILTLTTKHVTVKNGRAPQINIPGRYVVLEVRDTGVGMNPAVLARIFEPFFTTKGAGRGTGLGLNIIRRITEEHQGHIAVESQPDSGTVVRVWMPSVKGGAKAMMSQGLAKKSRRGYGTILVVEDNDALRSIVTLTLQRAGYIVFSGSTADQALSLCGKENRPFDLLLTDIVLPEMDGVALAKRMKEIQPAIRTIFMSGYPGNALTPITGFGGSDLLEKPFSLEKLLNTVREALAKDRGDLR